jgi:hypothetical protein
MRALSAVGLGVWFAVAGAFSLWTVFLYGYAAVDALGEDAYAVVVSRTSIALIVPIGVLFAARWGSPRRASRCSPWDCCCSP